MSEIKDDGGPAFPATVREDVLFAEGYRTQESHQAGMSLRDYFAAKAMQAMLRVDSDNGRFRDMGWRTAEMAYDVADAMLRARGEK
jgi:hypothetical protein